MSNRRSFIARALGLGAGFFAAPQLLAQPRNDNRRATAFNVPTITTEVGDLPYTMDGNTKVFRLVAQVFRQQIAPNKTIDVWGYNGSAPGPTMQVNQGDHIRVVFENQLPEPTSIHWHGFEDQIGYDGMPGISQAPTLPGETFAYEFDIHQAGTFFYHSHMAMQEMAGMLGAVIMHPRDPYAPHCDKDFVLHFQEYAVLPNNTIPNTMNMEFNWLTINGKAGPAVTPLIVRQGERIRIRMINLGMDHHPIHLHGHTFHITGTEGGRIQESAWWPGNTVLLGVAQARTVEFVANNPGDWMLHCHLPHHMMNQMSSQAGSMTRRAAMHKMQMPTQTTNGPLSPPQSAAAMADMASIMQTGQPQLSEEQMRDVMAMDMSPQAMSAQAKSIAPNANNVPNFPQDAYMEGPMMNMEHTPMLAIPENYGLRPGWSASMQGMMTFLRVLPPRQYEEVIGKMREARRPNDPYAIIFRTLLFFTLILSSTATVRAQDTPMPGMQMPTAKSTVQSPSKTVLPPYSDRSPQNTVTPPPSIRQSEAQQAQQPQQAQPVTGFSNLDTTTLQEPENPGHRTGEDLPVPDLLKDVSTRPALTLKQFEDWATAKNPTLAQARAVVQRTESQALQAGLPPNPIVAYDGEHIRGGSYGGGEQGAYVEQTIILGGKLTSRRDIYKRQADADRAAVDEQKLRILNDIQQAFYRTLTAQAMIMLRQHLLSTAADAATTAHQLANVGQADAPDVLQAEVAAEQAKIDLVEAQRAYLIDFRSLAILADQPDLLASPLEGDLENPPQIDPEAMIVQALANSPSIQRAQKLVAKAEAQTKDSSREARPDLQLRAGEWWSGEQINGTNKAAGPMSFASASVNLPLWNRNQGNKDASQADLERARANVVRIQLELRQRASSLAEEYLSARFNADRYATQLIPRARRAYQLYALKYEEMASAYPQVLLSQRTLFDLQAAHLQALNREWMAAIALNNCMLTGALSDPGAVDDAMRLNLASASQ
jgi:manganese oxidase